VGDSDCRGGHKCINMRCTSARACATTSSCPFAEYCEGGVCKFMSSRMCMADADCGNGQVCVAGVCAPEFEAPRWM
jgi:Cys-rich repeat protein